MRDFRDMAIGGLGLSGHHVRDAGRDLHRPQMADSRQPSHRFGSSPNTDVHPVVVVAGLKPNGSR